MSRSLAQLAGYCARQPSAITASWWLVRCDRSSSFSANWLIGVAECE
jgi:hypothetical protein